MAVCALPATVDLATITFAVIGGALFAIVVALLVLAAWPSKPAWPKRRT